MSLGPKTLGKMSVRTKILIVFLVLSIVSLAITGFVALYIIGNVGHYAETSSTTLGREAVNDSTTALQRSADERLLASAKDQAAITNVVLVDSSAEIGILADQAQTLQNNPPITSLIPSYYPDDRPRNPLDGIVVILAPGSFVQTQSDEFRTLAGMDDALRSVYHADGDLSSIYIATDSGIMRRYPWNGGVDPNYDPRNRDWFINAEANPGKTVWTEPYVDAAGNGLMVTCSRAVQTKFGTWVIATDVTIDTINQNILNMTLAGNGYAVLMDDQGTIISRPGLTAGTTQWDEAFQEENVYKSDNPELVEIGKNMLAGKTGTERVNLSGNETYVAYAPVTSLNWSFAVSMPVAQIVSPVKVTEARINDATAETGEQIGQQTTRVRDIFAGLSILLLIIVIALSIVLARIITRPVEALKEGTTALGEGNLDFRVRLESGDEFEDLAGSFNRMAGDLKKNIAELQKTTAEKERYTRELEIAKEIHQSFLPESVPEIPGYDIAAVSIPAMEIGGDFYDFIPVKTGKWGIAIADVSGKGISGAIFMALSRTLLHASGETHLDPLPAVHRANRLIFNEARSGMFVTVFYGVLDPVAHTFSYVNAGHNPPMIVHAEGSAGYLPVSEGVALGVLDEITIMDNVLHLAPRDVLLLYTDGVTEAFNGAEECYGEDRLAAFLSANHHLGAQDIIHRLIEEIRIFTGGEPQSDDITLVVVRVQ